MTTRFGINLDELNRAAKRIVRLKEGFNTGQNDRWSETTVLSSGLPSLQSFYAQVDTLMGGSHGVAENLKWHEREAQCVADCLRKAGADVCYVEDSLASVFRGTYESGAEELSHVSPLVDEQTATGRGMQFKDGRVFPSFINPCDPVVPEPLGRPVEQLVGLFSTVDITMLMQIKEQWDELNKSLSHQVEEIRKTAFIIQNAGTRDAFTYEASLGVFRWADSISGLRHGVQSVATQQGKFIESFIDTQNQLEEVSAQRTIAAANPAFQEYSFPEQQFTARADQVLSTTYNPGIAAADTKMVEVAVPMRAVISHKFMEPVITLPPAVTVTPLNPDNVGQTATQVQANPELSQPAPLTTPAPAETQQASVAPPTIPGADQALLDGATTTPNTPTTATPNIPNPTPNQNYGGAGAPPAGTQAAGYPAYAYGQPFYMRGSNGEYINPRTKLPGSDIPLSFFQQKQMRPFDLDYWHQHPHYPGNNGIPGGPNRTETGKPANIHRPSTAPRMGSTGATVAASGRGTGTGMMGAPMGGQSGQGGKNSTGKGRRRRNRTSAKNTNKVLRLDENGAIRGVIRHPSDPLYGTGR